MLGHALVFLARAAEHALAIAPAPSHTLILLAHMLVVCPCNVYLPMPPAQLYTHL